MLGACQEKLVSHVFLQVIDFKTMS